MHKWLKGVMICTVALSLAACTNQNTTDDTYRTQDNTMQNRYQTMDNQNGGTISSKDNKMDMNDKDSVHKNSNMVQSKQLSEEIAAMDNVDRAMVFLTDRNAYVGVVLEDDADFKRMDADRSRFKRYSATSDTTDNDVSNDVSDELPSVVKRDIAQKVKSLKPDLDYVFVSANPQFIDSLDDYVTALSEGRPVRGMIDEFNDMVERMFPTRVSDR